MAVLCVLAQVVGTPFVIGNSNNWVGVVGVVVGFLGFLLTIIMMRPKGWVLLGAFVVSLGVMISALVVGRPLYLAVFGETAECEVLKVEEVETSKYDSEMWYSLQCGDRRHDEVYLDTYNHPVGEVGDRIPVVFDRFGLLSPARPDDARTTYAWALPLVLLAALGFVAFAATRPVEPDPPRRSKSKPKPKPTKAVDQDFL